MEIAGFQNRDKIAEMVKGVGTSNPNSSPGQSGLGGLLGSLSGMLGVAAGGGRSGHTGGAGGLLRYGLNELLGKLKQNGDGDTAQSLIKSSHNKEILPPP